jgi:hypothetical protein
MTNHRDLPSHDDEPTQATHGENPARLRRNFIRVAGAALGAATLAIAGNASADCPDTKKKMSEGRKKAKAAGEALAVASSASKDAAASLKKYAETPDRELAKKAAADADLAARNIERYLKLNTDGLATFIMVHDEG